MFRQESRRTRLRRIKRYGNEDFHSFRNQLTSYLTCLGGHNVDDFVKRSVHLQSAFTECLKRSLDSYVPRKQKTVF
ncbi:hypothetical protein SprV_0100068600 [Sparganum proliferum]